MTAQDRTAATARLRKHLVTTALGGDHPLMVVVPRDALKELLAALERVRNEAPDYIKELVADV